MIELLVVISIICCISTVFFVLVDNARKKARDAKRIASIHEIQKGLDLYFDKYQTWPNASPDECATGWDVGYCSKENSNGFIEPLVNEGFFSKTPGDPSLYGVSAFKYYVYDAGSEGCSTNKGKFYILGIVDLETDTRPPRNFSGSGFSCPGRDWQNEFDYVVGKFEKN